MAKRGLKLGRKLVSVLVSVSMVMSMCFVPASAFAANSSNDATSTQSDDGMVAKRISEFTGEEEFATLAEAVKDAKAGDKIELLADAAATTVGLSSVVAGKEVTLDLNGHSVNGTLTYNGIATFNVIDSANKVADASAPAGLTSVNFRSTADTAVFNITGVKIVNNSSTIPVVSGQQNGWYPSSGLTMNLKDCIVTAEDYVTANAAGVETTNAGPQYALDLYKSYVNIKNCDISLATSSTGYSKAAIHTGMGGADLESVVDIIDSDITAKDTASMSGATYFVAGLYCQYDGSVDFTKSSGSAKGSISVASSKRACFGVYGVNGTTGVDTAITLDGYSVDINSGFEASSGALGNTHFYYSSESNTGFCLTLKNKVSLASSGTAAVANFDTSRPIAIDSTFTLADNIEQYTFGKLTAGTKAGTVFARQADESVDLSGYVSKFCCADSVDAHYIVPSLTADKTGIQWKEADVSETDEVPINQAYYNANKDMNGDLTLVTGGTYTLTEDITASGSIIVNNRRPVTLDFGTHWFKTTAAIGVNIASTSESAVDIKGAETGVVAEESSEDDAAIANVTVYHTIGNEEAANNGNQWYSAGIYAQGSTALTVSDFSTSVKTNNVGQKTSLEDYGIYLNGPSTTDISDSTVYVATATADTSEAYGLTPEMKGIYNRKGTSSITDTDVMVENKLQKASAKPMKGVEAAYSGGVVTMTRNAGSANGVVKVISAGLGTSSSSTVFGVAGNKSSGCILDGYSVSAEATNGVRAGTGVAALYLGQAQGIILKNEVSLTATGGSEKLDNSEIYSSGNSTTLGIDSSFKMPAGKTSYSFANAGNSQATSSGKTFAVSSDSKSLEAYASCFTNKSRYLKAAASGTSLVWADDDTVVDNANVEIDQDYFDDNASSSYLDITEGGTYTFKGNVEADSAYIRISTQRAVTIDFGSYYYHTTARYGVYMPNTASGKLTLKGATVGANDAGITNNIDVEPVITSVAQSGMRSIAAVRAAGKGDFEADGLSVRLHRQVKGADSFNHGATYGFLLGSNTVYAADVKNCSVEVDNTAINANGASGPSDGRGATVGISATGYEPVTSNTEDDVDFGGRSRLSIKNTSVNVKGMERTEITNDNPSTGIYIAPDTAIDSCTVAVSGQKAAYGISTNTKHHLFSNATVTNTNVSTNVATVSLGKSVGFSSHKEGCITLAGKNVYSGNGVALKASADKAFVLGDSFAADTPFSVINVSDSTTTNANGHAFATYASGFTPTEAQLTALTAAFTNGNSSSPNVPRAESDGVFMRLTDNSLADAYITSGDTTTYYENLAAACSAAADGDTVVVQRDFSGNAFIMPSSTSAYSFTIDVGTHAVGAMAFGNASKEFNANVTVKGAGVDAEGSVAGIAFVPYSGAGSLTLSGLNITSLGEAWTLTSAQAGSSKYFRAGTCVFQYTAAKAKNEVLTLDNCHVIGKTLAVSNCQAVHIQGGAFVSQNSQIDYTVTTCSAGFPTNAYGVFASAGTANVNLIDTDVNVSTDVESSAPASTGNNASNIVGFQVSGSGKGTFTRSADAVRGSISVNIGERDAYHNAVALGTDNNTATQLTVSGNGVFSCSIADTQSAQGVYGFYNAARSKTSTTYPLVLKGTPSLTLTNAGSGSNVSVLTSDKIAIGDDFALPQNTQAWTVAHIGNLILESTGYVFATSADSTSLAGKASLFASASGQYVSYADDKNLMWVDKDGGFIAENENLLDDNGAPTKYLALSLALSAASNGDTIKLLADTKIDGALTLNKGIALDLAGRTLTVNAVNQAEALLIASEKEAVTIKDSGRDVEGDEGAPSHEYGKLALNLTPGTSDNGFAGIRIEGTTYTDSNGLLTKTSADTIFSHVSCEIKAAGSAGTTFAGIRMGNAGQLTVTDSDISVSVDDQKVASTDVTGIRVCSAANLFDTNDWQPKGVDLVNSTIRAYNGCERSPRSNLETKVYEKVEPTGSLAEQIESKFKALAKWGTVKDSGKGQYYATFTIDGTEYYVTSDLLEKQSTPSVGNVYSKAETKLSGKTQGIAIDNWSFSNKLALTGCTVDASSAYYDAFGISATNVSNTDSGTQATLTMEDTTIKATVSDEMYAGYGQNIDYAGEDSGKLNGVVEKKSKAQGLKLGAAFSHLALSGKISIKASGGESTDVEASYVDAAKDLSVDESISILDPSNGNNAGDAFTRLSDTSQAENVMASFKDANDKLAPVVGSDGQVVWGEQTYSVSFQTDDQILSKYSQKGVECGRTLSLPTADEVAKESTEQTEYEFIGWSSDGTETADDYFNPGDAKTARITGTHAYKAVYKEKTRSFTVTFTDDAGKTLASGKVRYGISGAKLLDAVGVAEPTKSGSTFIGWYASTSSMRASDTDYHIDEYLSSNLPAVTADVTYRATFATSVEDGYKVTFCVDGRDYTYVVADGATPSFVDAWTACRPSDHTTATVTTTPAKIDKEDGHLYTFAGWQANGEGDLIAADAVPAVNGADATYVANYTGRLTSTGMTFYYFNPEAPGSYSSANTVSVSAEYGSKDYAPTLNDAFTRFDYQGTIYTFKGWSTRSGDTEPIDLPAAGTISTSTATSSGTVSTFYAVYSKTDAEYTITLDPNNGDEAKVVGGVKYGTTAINLAKDNGLESPEYKGSEVEYDFKGWSTDKDATTPTGQLSATGDATWYAVYGEKEQRDITLHPELGSSEVAATAHVYNGNALSTGDFDDKAPVVAGKKFAGWADADGDAADMNAKVYENMDLYATYSDLSTASGSDGVDLSKVALASDKAAGFDSVSGFSHAADGADANLLVGLPSDVTVVSTYNVALTGTSGKNTSAIESDFGSMGVSLAVPSGVDASKAKVYVLASDGTVKELQATVSGSNLVVDVDDYTYAAKKGNIVIATVNPKKSDKTEAKKAATTFTVNVKTVTATAVAKAALKAGANTSSATSITLGSKVKTIKASAFKSFKKVKTITVKTKKLTKKSVKKALKGSKVKTIKVKVGNAKTNKKYVKKYKKIFTKKIAGKKASVKK